MDKVVRLGTVEVYEGKNVSVYCKIKISEDGRLSISGVEGPTKNGNAAGSCGQIVMHLTSSKINPAPAWDEYTIRRFLELWDEWHLNDMRAGCWHQRERGEAEVGKPCKTCGYKYGTAWLKEELPGYVVEFMEGLPETDKTPAWV